MVKIRFYGEGTTDVGRHKKNDPSVLQAFVKNILAHLEVPNDFEWEGYHIKKIPIHGRRGKTKTGTLSGFKRRVDAAIVDAFRKRCFNGVVFVVDHDGDKSRLEDMIAGRDSARDKNYYLPTAVGTAKYSIESWLLADRKARRDNLGKSGGDDIGKIEEKTRPKQKVWALLYEKYLKDDDIEPKLDEWKLKLIVAQKADVEEVMKECPVSFKSFVGEVEENLLPIFKANL